MSSVRRLIAHDLREHGPLFAMWAAVVVAHPLAAALPWTEDAVALGWVLATALVAARVVLTVLLVATLVQSDSPTDDRAFWRTTPIPPATMAAVKLTVALAVFVGTPLLVVLSVALALGVPVSHWPVTAAGVILSETPLVLAAMIAAVLTRRTSTAVVGLASAVALGVGVEILLMDAAMGSRPWLKLAAPPHGTWTAIWLCACLLGAAIVAWWGRLVWSAAACSVIAIVAGLFLLWLVPASRAMTPDLGPGQAATIERLEVRRDRHVLRLGAVITHPFGDAAGVILNGVSIRLGGEVRKVPDAVSGWRSPLGSERVIEILDLSESAVASLQGTPLTIQGYVVGHIPDRRVLARVPLALAARFGDATTLGVIDRINQPTEDAPTLADVRMLFLRGTGITFDSVPWDASISVPGDEQVRPLTVDRDERDALASFVRLPVLARPFECRRVSLRVPKKVLTDGIGLRGDLEFSATERDLRVLPVAATFVMPPVPREHR